MRKKKEILNFVPVIRGGNTLEVKNAAEESEIVLIGAIGKSWFDDSGITEQEVRDALKSVPKGRPITLKVNSEGGSVKEGLGIYNAIKERSADITAKVTGYALSIASVFPLAASKVVSPRSAVWMMHKAWSWASGNADDMRQTADMLAEHDEALAEIYADETGRPIEEMRDAMAKETWIRGSAAVDFGLADEGDEEPDEAAASYRPLSKAYLGRCVNMPAEVLNMISAPTQGAALPPAGGNTQQPKEETIMKRETVIALLNKRGVSVPENATDEQLLDLMVPAPATMTASSQVPPATIAPTATGVSLEAFNAEKRKRIRGEVLRRAENKVPNANLDRWIDRAMNDEDGIYAELDAMPVNMPGGDPIGGSIEIVSEGEHDRILKLKKPSERFDAFRADWDNLIADAFRRDVRGEKPRLFNRYAARPVAGFGLPVNTNTFSSTITTAFLLDGVITNLQNRWAPLMVFTRDFSQDPYKPLAVHVLKNVTATTAAQTDATNFEAGNGDTIAPVSVTMHQYTKNFAVTNTELNSGLRMTDLITINAAGIADKITAVATAPITKAIFTATPVVSSAAAFGYTELQTLWGQLKKSPIKNLLLDGEYLARVINQPTFYQTAGQAPGGGWRAFGWDYIALNTNWTGAGTATVGFACNPQAIAAVAGLPLTPPDGIPGNTLQIATATVPDVGISIAHYSWFSLGSRTAWNSFDLMFGAQQADTTAGVVVASA